MVSSTFKHVTHGMLNGHESRIYMQSVGSDDDLTAAQHIMSNARACLQMVPWGVQRYEDEVAFAHFTGTSKKARTTDKSHCRAMMKGFRSKGAVVCMRKHMSMVGTLLCSDTPMSV